MTGVKDTSGKFIAAVFDTGDNCMFIIVIDIGNFIDNDNEFIQVIDTGGRLLISGVIDTGNKCMMVTSIVINKKGPRNVSPVPLTPVVN